MRFDPKNPPRKFSVHPEIELADCGNMYLAEDEQVTFITPKGGEHDFVAKSWGFYATPSVNGRLLDQGFKTALVKNITSGRLYVMVVEREKLDEFTDYVQAFGMEILEWLDERG